MIQAVCDHFELGTLQCSPEPINGGRQHALYKVVTEQGCFAVKQLNSLLLAKPGVHHDYQQAELVANQVFALGLPACTALRQQDNRLCLFEQHYYLVFDWLDAQGLLIDQVTPQHAAVIGRLLSQIHQANLSMPPRQQDDFYYIEREWSELLEQMFTLNIASAKQLKQALPNLLRWSTQAEQAYARLSKDRIVSHRDLDTFNVLWHDQHSPVVIDWELAGLIHPDLDCWNTALYWGFAAREQCDDVLINAVITAYQQSGRQLGMTLQQAMPGVMGLWLGWLALNCHQSISPVISKAGLELIEREIHQSLTALHKMNEF